MTDEQGLSLRDMILGVSGKVDELTKLLHTHIEKMVSQKEGMERLGNKTDALEDRVRAVEQAAAASAPDNKSTSDWVRLVIAMVIGGAVTSALAHLFK